MLYSILVSWLVRSSLLRMASGWKYTVAVPSWSQTQLRGDEAVVFYSIEVKLLPPEDLAQPARKHVVLRRFSHFQKLFLRLKEVHGAQLLAGIKLPPKLAMSNVAKHPELIDRRRGDLEQWYAVVLWCCLSFAVQLCSMQKPGGDATLVHTPSHAHVTPNTL